MSETILTNIEIHQIEQEIEKISNAFNGLDPELCGDAEEIARYNEVLAYYQDLLENSFKKARVFESGLRLVV